MRISQTTHRLFVAAIWDETGTRSATERYHIIESLTAIVFSLGCQLPCNYKKGLPLVLLSFVYPWEALLTIFFAKSMFSV